MNKEELIKFLKEHLELNIDIKNWNFDKDITISLDLRHEDGHGVDEISSITLMNREIKQ